MTPHLARIVIYPVKSLDGLSLSTARLLPEGALEYDRRFALVDREGQLVNAKRTAAIHGLSATIDTAQRRITLCRRGGGRAADFHFDGDRAALEAWLSDYFGLPIEIQERPGGGFPDDCESPGPTLISTATLAAVASWFPGMSLGEVRERFRANLEIDGVEAFWEDRLYAAQDETVRFRIGEAVFAGTNPCQRCVVPTRAPRSGEALHGFAKEFAERRAEELPAWADRSRFNHFYRLAVNTRVVDVGGPLRLGDTLTILGKSA